MVKPEKNPHDRIEEITPPVPDLNEFLRQPKIILFFICCIFGGLCASTDGFRFMYDDTCQT